MYLSKRQKIMFIFFIIQFAYIFFAGAVFQDINIILGSLSSLLFLGALYLERNDNSRYVLVLASAMIIVHGLINYFLSQPLSLNYSEIFKLLMYVAIYFFALNFYRSDFNNSTKRVIIIVLSAPLLIISIVNGIYLSQYMFTSLELFLILFGFYAEALIPLAMITYTLLSFKQIDY